MGGHLVKVSMHDRQWIGVSRKPFTSAAFRAEWTGYVAA